MKPELELLGRAGLDSERAHLRCWLGHERLSNKRGLLLLSRLKTREAGFRTDALRGRILSLSGRFSEARSLLDGAVAKLPEEAAIRAWRGELALVQGDVAGAMKDLDAAIRLDSSFPWSYVYRSAARFKQGHISDGQKDVAQVLKLKPGSSVGCALKAVLEAQSDRKESANDWFDRALKRAQGNKSWIYALRGAMRANWNELGGARKDMNRALKSEQSPWVLLERAAVARRMGEFWTAFEDLKKASAALPNSAEPALRAAAIHLDQAQYKEALDCLTRALRQVPDDASIYQRRARVFFVQGMLSEAQEDIEAACRLSPEDRFLRQEWVQLMIVRGFDAEARRVLRTEEFPAGAKEFWLGYLECRRRNYSRAQDYFSVAEKFLKGSNEELAKKARLYRLTARILQDMPPRKHSTDKKLSLIGLGYRHPFQVSFGAIAALRDCEVIYSNLSDPRATDFLGLFPASFKVIVFRTLHQQAQDSARTVMAGFRRYNKISLVTRGQPVVYGRLAYCLVEAARRRKIACDVPPSVSIFETIPSLVGNLSDCALGLQVRDASSLGDINFAFPLVIYLPLSKQIDALLGILFKIYPKKYACYLLPGAGENEFTAQPIFLDGLKSALKQSDPACTLFLPARGERALS